MLERFLPKSENLLLRSLRGTEWSQITDYVSPSFFEVLPASALWSQLRELAGNARDGKRFLLVQRAVESRLAEHGSGVRIGRDEAEGAGEIDALDEEARRARGQRVLEIYFSQIAGSPAALLDLRASRFQGAEPLHWNPRPLFVQWDAEFLDGLRNLYGGYYEDDDARFRSALKNLQLEAAEDLFREHFGADDQRAVRFEATSFHATFHEAFVRCRDEGVRLHRNFLALGIYLGCLYDHLEALGLSFDVRGAYERSSSANDTR